MSGSIIKEVAVQIYNNKDRKYFLFLDPRYGWGPVKGGIEPKDRKSRHTAWRELWEETRLTNNEIPRLMRVDHGWEYSFSSLAGVNLVKVYPCYLALTTAKKVKIGPEHYKYKLAEYQGALKTVRGKGPRGLIRVCEEIILNEGL